MTPKHQMMASWYAVLAFMFFMLYGFDAPRVLAHFVNAERVNAISSSPVYFLVGALFAFGAAAIMIFCVRRDFD